MDKIFITRYEGSTREEPTVSIWYRQKPAWSDGSQGNDPCWWCNCHGRRDVISRDLCKLMFGVAPVKNELITLQVSQGAKISNFIQTNRQTPNDYMNGKEPWE